MPIEPVLRVLDSDSPSGIAKCLAERLSLGPVAFLEALGPSATFKAVEGVVLCRSLVELTGSELRMIPSFVEWRVLDESRTAVRFEVGWAG